MRQEQYVNRKQLKIKNKWVAIFISVSLKNRGNAVLKKIINIMLQNPMIVTEIYPKAHRESIVSTH